MYFIFSFFGGWVGAGGVMNLNASSVKGANNVPESSVESAVCSGRPLHVFWCAFHVPLLNFIPTIKVGELSHFHC